MNIYDFDGTIYRGDSTVDFFLFSLKQQPGLIRYLPVQLWGTGMYALKQYSKRRWKECFFSFLKGLDTPAMVEDFWKTHYDRIEPWYLAQQREDDLVISASPEFLLSPICRALGVGLLATQVDEKNGSFLSENCRGEEKVRRLQAAFPHPMVEKFYSDSLSDLPLAKLAGEPYLVDKGIVTPWNIE